MTQSTPLHIVTRAEDETPPDGFGAGFLEYSIRSSFRDLCRLVGFENARAEVAEIINAEANRKRITIDG